MERPFRIEAMLSGTQWRAEKVFDADRQLAHANTGGVIDSGGDGRRNAGQANLAHATRAEAVEHLVRVVKEGDVDFRRVGVGGDNVIGKVVVDGSAEARVIDGLFEEAMPTPMTTAPSIWLRAGLGLRMRPASITVTTRETRRRAVSGCQVTSANCAPKECLENLRLDRQRYPRIFPAGGARMLAAVRICSKRTPVSGDLSLRMDAPLVKAIASGFCPANPDLCPGLQP
jgi:hypothetical protein